MYISSLRITFLIILLLKGFISFAQLSKVKGKVFDIRTNQPIPFASVFINESNTGSIADSTGVYVIENIMPGVYSITCSFIGYKATTQFEIRVTSTKPTVVDFALEESSTRLSEVVVTTSVFNKTEESPLSIKTIGSDEIYRSPGGNRDISKVIQILPGVGSSVSFRNDVIVRGGAPNENRFYIDGIEIPNINHFATQGSSGGPVGLLNVNFIREVDFYSGAFPANRGNSLSSVLEFRQINGNEENLSGTAMIGSSDVGITLEGPAGKKSTFLLSARRSYLQLLFKALALPFLPTYNDFQLKQTIKFNSKNSLTIIGLGAIDEFRLNKEVNDGLSDLPTIERNNYILNYLPVNTQWNYAVGLNYKVASTNGATNVFLSRNHLKNKSVKYKNNSDRLDDLILNYSSAEIENKFRIEKSYLIDSWKLNYGLGYENSLYTNATFKNSEINNVVFNTKFQSRLNLNKFSLFGQISKKLYQERLIVSAGLRTDINDYSKKFLNPIQQISPRFSASISLTNKLFLNFNTGRYYQLPAYTVLGYRDSTGKLVNKENNIKYIRCDHLVSGVEYNPNNFLKITVEGFYKKYNYYPLLLNDSISLANLGGDFGVIGNEPSSPISKGRSYGLEFFIQQKLSSTYYGILSLTIYRSEFTDKTGNYRPSAWDNRFIVNTTFGKKIKKNWETGLKFRLLGGAPYTPYDVELSSVKTIWDVTGQGIPDWNKLNEERLPIAHTLDVRVDKKWFFKKWSLNIYLDIQNIYNFELKGQPFLDVRKDSDGTPLTDPSDSSSYQTKLIENTDGNILPSIGIMVEF